MYNYLYYSIYPNIEIEVDNLKISVNVNESLENIILLLRDLFCFENILYLTHENTLLDDYTKTLYDYGIHNNYKLECVFLA